MKSSMMLGDWTGVYEAVRRSSKSKKRGKLVSWEVDETI
ncbi:hypothetical protein BSG1_09538 [Bacillus sp. SG-1]|nr:hypothetical protein BSG1_09538 [Bacillus sp. SG-1]